MSTIYIIYGSETGNARLLAESAVSQLKSQGLHAACAGMEDITPEVIGAMRLLLIITSTWGDGDPPSNASELHYQLSKTERRFEKLRYAVFALGMASFEHFCRAGEDFDDFLARAGAKRLLPLTKSDDNGEADLEEWLRRLTPLLRAEQQGSEAEGCRCGESCKGCHDCDGCNEGCDEACDGGKGGEGSCCGECESSGEGRCEACGGGEEHGGSGRCDKGSRE